MEPAMFGLLIFMSMILAETGINGVCDPVCRISFYYRLAFCAHTQHQLERMAPRFLYVSLDMSPRNSVHASLMIGLRTSALTLRRRWAVVTRLSMPEFFTPVNAESDITISAININVDSNLGTQIHGACTSPKLRCTRSPKLSRQLGRSANASRFLVRHFGP